LIKLIRAELQQSNVQKHLDRLVEEGVAVKDKDEKYLSL
jgi:hypothetical protein